MQLCMIYIYIIYSPRRRRQLQGLPAAVRVHVWAPFGSLSNFSQAVSNWDVEAINELNHLDDLLTNVAIENSPFLGDFPNRTSIFKGFPTARFDYKWDN